MTNTQLREANALGQRLGCKELVLYSAMALTTGGAVHDRAIRIVQAALDVDAWLVSKGYL